MRQPWLLALALGLAGGPSAAAAQGRVTVKYAIEVDTRHPSYKAAEFMARRAAELSGGRLEVQLFPSAQLGGSREMVEGMQVGTMELTMATAAVMSRVVISRRR